MRWHLGEVEDDRGPELDVGLDRAIRTALAQLGERGLLQRLGGVVAAGAELPARGERRRGASESTGSPESESVGTSESESAGTSESASARAHANNTSAFGRADTASDGAYRGGELHV